MKSETLVSVDIETSGPIPGEYSMLSLGACIVGAVDSSFYREFRPNSDKFIPEALAVSGLQLSKLSQSGADPKQGMQEFKAWIETNCRDTKPVFVAFNAPFDWSFVNYYFHFYLGANPFGFSGLDIKAYFMGLTGCAWDDTRSSRISEILKVKTEIKHNALEDALAQAQLFEKIRIFASKREGHS
jgi:DNA polymerase III epsilon subunit-like protein